jgi:protein-disulfide isomerase
MLAKRLSLRSFADVMTSIVLIAAALTVIYNNVFADQARDATSLPVPPEPLSLDGAAMRGSKDAQAVMIVYSDFECPFCRRFAQEVLPEIERRYVATGKVALAFRHLPLPIHKQATRAAVLAECAGQQDRFWEMHDMLFAQHNLDDGTLLAIPKSISLDGQTFEACLRNQAVGARVQASIDQAAALSVRSTPSFFFGQRLSDGRVRVLGAASGARPVTDFTDRLDAVLPGRSIWSSWMSFFW